MAMGEQIPLRDELDSSSGLSTGLASGLGKGGLKAILFEIATMLQRLASTGEVSQIDLLNLPLTSKEYASLKTLLGDGEARIELKLGGLTLCRETAVPAVWWVEHFNDTGTNAETIAETNAAKAVAEFIEVAEVPHILKYEADELQLGLARLNRKLEMAGNNQPDNNQPGNNQEESDHE